MRQKWHVYDTQFCFESPKHPRSWKIKKTWLRCEWSFRRKYTVVHNSYFLFFSFDSFVYVLWEIPFLKCVLTCLDINPFWCWLLHWLTWLLDQCWLVLTSDVHPSVSPVEKIIKFCHFSYQNIIQRYQDSTRRLYLKTHSSNPIWTLYMVFIVMYIIIHDFKFSFVRPLFDVKP